MLGPVCALAEVNRTIPRFESATEVPAVPLDQRKLVPRLGDQGVVGGESPGPEVERAAHVELRAVDPADLGQETGDQRVGVRKFERISAALTLADAERAGGGLEPGAVGVAHGPPSCDADQVERL